MNRYVLPKCDSTQLNPTDHSSSSRLLTPNTHLIPLSLTPPNKPPNRLDTRHQQALARRRRCNRRGERRVRRFRFCCCLREAEGFRCVDVRLLDYFLMQVGVGDVFRAPVGPSWDFEWHIYCFVGSGSGVCFLWSSARTRLCLCL